MNRLSPKQLKILAFPYTQYDALICDGAIRSGKTSIMTIAFVDWAMDNFNHCSFALCGKSVKSAVRNIVTPYMSLKYAKTKYRMRFNRADNRITIKRGDVENTFYIFGGKDESSASLIQGLTLAGVLLDEVALLVRSFVEQALARCSVEGSKFWFNCNPDKPKHWFNVEWVEKAKEHNALHLHFLLEDNPSLSQKMIDRYYAMYTGVFFQRFVLGLWVNAEGVIYKQLADDLTTYLLSEVPNDIIFGQIGVDFGGNGSGHAFQMTGFSRGLKKIVTLEEHYHDNKKQGIIDPDEFNKQFVKFVQLCKKKYRFPIVDIYADSAEQTLIAGMKTAAYKNGLGIEIHNARKGEIIDRIRLYNSLIAQHRYFIMNYCTVTQTAFCSALWNEKKQNDERLDDGTTNIDTLDAQEYSTENYMNDIMEVRF